MFTLVTDRSRFFRVKRGQSGAEIESELCVPVYKKAFGGAIIYTAERLEVYTAKPFDTYDSLSAATGVPSEELRRINSSRPVYPSCKLFVPCKK